MAAGGAVVVVFGGWATRTLCGGKNKVLSGGSVFSGSVVVFSLCSLCAVVFPE